MPGIYYIIITLFVFYARVLTPIAINPAQVAYLPSKNNVKKFC